MPKVKQKRFNEMRKLENVFEWTDYHSIKPFPSHTWQSEIFKNEKPIVLELACGKGEYSNGLAEIHPDKNFIGVDIKGNRMWVGATEALEEGRDNIRFLRAYIDHLDQYFEEKSISEIWILFPDPQLNKERKRLTSPKFLTLYRKFLKPGAIIKLKTDSTELYEYTQEVIEEEKLELVEDLPDVYKTHADHPELSIKTYYEGMHLKKGKTIHFISFKLS